MGDLPRIVSRTIEASGVFIQTKTHTGKIRLKTCGRRYTYCNLELPVKRFLYRDHPEMG